ncbi:MAG: ABC transporter ATP-binding protein [Rhodobacteraceae bacterium]|nr:ABC transporter ATP-binding protein [Paracoccaceae bacterium]MAY46229.1 ABC transporter ATP-binding protein [Paracoccaceae bacterium]|tara:strand:+ start:78 stop:686 length:609 start_codon:yes stop_codon:yes gene_type:complete
MPISHLLEDFRTTDPAETDTLLMSELDLEEQRLAAFEKGYSAGWEDAIAADTQGKAHLSAALTQNLEDAAFSYHEALTQMQASVMPVFEAIAEQLLPGMIRAGLAPQILRALDDIATQAMGRPLVLAIPPGTEQVIAPLLPEIDNVEIILDEDPTLTDGQARLHLDDGGVEIDLTALADEMRKAITAFVFETRKETSSDRTA